MELDTLLQSTIFKTANCATDLAEFHGRQVANHFSQQSPGQFQVGSHQGSCNNAMMVVDRINVNLCVQTYACTAS